MNFGKYCSLMLFTTFRLERVMSQIIRGLPLLSAAERTMLKELENMKDNAPDLKNQLAQVKAKLNWQVSQVRF